LEGNRQSTSKVSSMLSIFTVSKVYVCMVSDTRNGVVRYESVMHMRNKLEELGKMKGVNQDEKGGSTTVQSVL